jgi:hypothetical protein
MARTPGRLNEPDNAPEGADATPEGNPPNETAEKQDADSIARRAYERYEMRGGEHGRDQEDWFEAERELNRPRR